MRPGMSLAAESWQPAPVMPSLLAWLVDPISPPCIGLLLWPAGRGLLQLRLIICSRHCHNSQLLHTEPGPRKRFGESVKFVGSTATHLASTVWPALPQGECRKWGFPYLRVLTVFLFLQALERFLSAWRLKQLLIFPCQVWTPARRISAGAPILVVYWISTGLARTTTGPWRDSCPHPPLPDRISGVQSSSNMPRARDQFTTTPWLVLWLGNHITFLGQFPLTLDRLHRPASLASRLHHWLVPYGAAD